MSDADDPDKTRIAPRVRPTASRPTTGTSAPYISAPQPRKDREPLPAKTQLPGALPITESRGAEIVKPTDILKSRFVLERILGAGGMGVVYKAKDLLKVEAKDRDPYVAIKVLGEEFKSHPEAFIALQRESRKTQRIAHPNIVNVYDFDKDGDTVFMTMEFLEGTPLDKLIKKHRGVGLAKEQAWQIMDGICAALSYAHEQRLIHSDLKPGNIFVTATGHPKVFDFGIARAVAKAEHIDGNDSEDRTLFDAGNLGALTPAYASLEMLEGDPPDVRDDIYALGCIFYELLTGEHPYKRKNAKEAFRKSLKMERPKQLSGRQWRVLQRALALQREHRTGSVSEFWQEMNKPQGAKLGLGLALVAASALIGVALWQPWAAPPQALAPQVSEAEVRSEIETKVRVEILEQNLNDLFTTLAFDARWEAVLWERLQQLRTLLGADDPATTAAFTRAYTVYVQKIEQALTEQQWPQAERWLANISRYANADDAKLAGLRETLALAQAEQAATAAREREQQAAARKAASQQAAARSEQQAQASTSRQFDQALASLNEQLACNRLLDMPQLERLFGNLRTADRARYNSLESQLVEDLASCIVRIKRNFPQEGLKAQQYAQTMFPNRAEFAQGQTAQGEQDNCKPSLAGLGSRSRRARCQDTLASGTKSPLTVVIPQTTGIAAFALGRYEVRVDEFNQYCVASGRCEAQGDVNGALPVTHLSIAQVEGYLQWLSEQSGRVYRLPTMAEWLHAASTQDSGSDANRNCKLDLRGIQKGGTLLNANIGQQNSWGVVNLVGNAREWVTERNNLLAIGGSFNTEMEQCNVQAVVQSEGHADHETGFRVARELQ